MTLLKTLLFIVLGYYLLKLLVRMFAPKILGYAARKTEERFKEAFQHFEQRDGHQEDRVGNVIIEKKTPKRRKGTEKVGEYVDFEEVD
ncbi:DUF4834 family protein [Maribacter sp. 2307ULW6-5]|uniref:DUF4834 family protein n=1 Tax=Maribacter sp. 2307ULW6-5 TaxID=3386275 RepID=UPI0039BC3F04